MLRLIRDWVTGRHQGQIVMAPPSRPAGKLGEIIRCLEASPAASLHDLMTLTGWQRHTVHGALSRLRARGFEIIGERYGSGMIYRLSGTRTGETS